MRPPILHVIPYLWSGAGGVVTRLCETQRQLGPVTLVTTGQPGEHADWPSYRARLRKAGVVHHAIDFFHRDQDRFWTSVLELDAVIRKLEPGVIHAHAGVPCCGAVIARSMSGRRARVIGQMYSWGPGRPAWMDRQDTWGFSQADRVVCSARAYWDVLIASGVPRRKLAYLPWGLPLDNLPIRPAPPGGRTAPMIGFVGRIEPRKGQLELVDAFADLHRKMPAARLELVGPVADEAYARAIRAAIRRHAIKDAVALTGEVRDVVSLMRRWDIFVSLSSDEGQGLAVLEAMAVGVPVAARPVAGIEDFLVEGKTGFAIRGTAPRTVAGVILRAWHAAHARTRIARGARAMVERRYSWDATVAAFDRLYWK